MGNWILYNSKTFESNSTGSFNIPPNSGDEPITYNVQYTDGNGSGGTTSITVPVCSASLQTNNITIKYGKHADSAVVLYINAEFPVETDISCKGIFKYANTSNATVTSEWKLTLRKGSKEYGQGFNAPNISAFKCCGITSQGVAEDSKYRYEYKSYPPCS